MTQDYEHVNNEIKSKHCLLCKWRPTSTFVVQQKYKTLTKKKKIQH